MPCLVGDQRGKNLLSLDVGRSGETYGKRGLKTKKRWEEAAREGLTALRLTPGELKLARAVRCDVAVWRLVCSNRLYVCVCVFATGCDGL